MEIYTIDAASNLPELPIENYSSFLWTDRYAAHGDFSLKALPTPDLEKRLVPGSFLGFDESDNIMYVESVLQERNGDGSSLMTVTGRSLTCLFEKRPTTTSLVSSAPIRKTGSAGAIIAALVSDNAVSPTTVSKNALPGLTSTNQAGTTPSFTADIKLGTLYQAIKDPADAYDLGFRIRKPVLGVPTLRFEVYKGNNRAVLPNPTVAFGTFDESLTDTKYLRSNKDHYTAALVFNETAGRMVYATGYSGASGFQHKVLVVEANDIKGATATETNNLLDARGLEALGEHTYVTLFDGQVNPNANLRYQRDYFLGDIVGLRQSQTVYQQVRVTEHIWSFDESGYKSFPTLSALGGSA